MKLHKQGSNIASETDFNRLDVRHEGGCVEWVGGRVCGGVKAGVAAVAVGLGRPRVT